jgi:hypothetical protein
MIDILPAEECNERGDVRYRANQIHGTVVLIAEGSHGTPGFEVFFEPSAIDVFPPEFILKHRRPSGQVIQQETPFTVDTSFNSADTIEELTVLDAQGRQRVKVDQTPD